jgi:two-component system chemotaxis response regulator CheB
MYEVIVIDDSMVERKMLSKLINSLSDFEVVATARDAYDAREKIKKYEPDLITLDINMPKMDGINFLKNLMRLHPMPAIIVSSKDSVQDKSVDEGAIGFIAKPKQNEDISLFKNRIEETLNSFLFIFDKYKQNKPKSTYKNLDTIQVEPKHHPDTLLKATLHSKNALEVIAIGSSTGGVEALFNIFSKLPLGLAPIVITQHIPYGFSTSFASRLNNESEITVIEAKGGEILQKSYAYLAPGNRHMIFEQKDNKYIIKLLDGVRISRHKPSVDIMFRSVSNEFGNKAMGIILTGMGDDGSIGIVELKQNGGYTIAQSQKSCVVYGMPKKAYEAGGIVKNDVDLDDIANEIINFHS